MFGHWCRAPIRYYTAFLNRHDNRNARSKEPRPSCVRLSWRLHQRSPRIQLTHDDSNISRPAAPARSVRPSGVVDALQSTSCAAGVVVLCQGGLKLLCGNELFHQVPFQQISDLRIRPCENQSVTETSRKSHMTFMNPLHKWRGQLRRTFFSRPMFCGPRVTFWIGHRAVFTHRRCQIDGSRAWKHGLQRL